MERVILLLKRIPSAVYLIAAGVLLCTVGVWWHGNAVDRVYAQGVKDTQEAANVMVALYAEQNTALRARKDSIVTKHDTLWIRAKTQIVEVEKAVAALPDSVAQVPEVARLVAATKLLAIRVDSVMEIRLTERAAFVALHEADSLQMNNLVITANAAHAHALAVEKERDARVTKSKAAVIAGVTGIIVGGIVRLVSGGN